MVSRRALALGLILGALLVAGAIWQALSSDRYFILASATSTDNSGLFDHLLPPFMEKTGIRIRVVAVGTGQAVRLARNGDADAVLVHHLPSEQALVEEGR